MGNAHIYEKWIANVVVMNNTELRYNRYCKELEELNKKVRRKLKQINEVEKKL